jgi:phospholipid transport system substrate-binding protein
MNILFAGNLFRNSLYAVTIFASLLAAPALAAPVDDASKYVESLGNSAIKTLSNKKLNKEMKSEKIEQIFRKNVDIVWIGRFVLGRFWRQATDDQKKRYLKEYETFLVQHYASRFADYSSGSFKITGARDAGNNEFIISMQIKSDESGSEPILVDYRVRKTISSFAVFDIIVEGVSMITTQRSEFNSVISNKGMDYLISQLAHKSASVETKAH